MEIPGYKIEEEIGVGGMATVYLATQESLARTVALKVMAPELMADPSAEKRFLKEGEIVARLNHPNIVTVYDIGRIDSVYYMAMEYIEGGNLITRIQQGMTVEQALSIARQVAGALKYAHKKGFIHRDVKPANILFKEDDRIVLSDFGVAKALRSQTTQLTSIGQSIGTPDYMSPEQVMGKPLDARSDLYSLGVVFYEMLTLEKPFKGEDVFGTAMSHLNAPVPRLPERLPAYQVIIDRLLAKSPDERFQSAGQLIGTLDGLSSAKTRQVDLSLISAAQGEKTRFIDARKQPLWLKARSLTGALKLVALFGAFIMVIAAVVIWQGPSKIDPRTQKIIELFVQAERNIAASRLTEPISDNAYQNYRYVLKLDPRNEAALAGIEKIADHYEKQARSKQEKGQLGEVLALTEKGLQIDRQHEGLLALQTDFFDRLGKQRRSSKVAHLLMKAKQQLATSQLTEPQGDNAYESFCSVLASDPGNEEAHFGLQAIAAQLEKLARTKEEKGLLDDGLALVEKGLAIYPQHEGLLSHHKEILQTLGEERRQREVVRLLDYAEQYDDEQPTGPCANNAIFALYAVLRIESENDQVLARLRDIGRRLAERARHADTQGRPQEALTTITQGLSLVPDDPSLLQLQARIKRQLEVSRSKSTISSTLSITLLIYIAGAGLTGALIFIVLKVRIYRWFFEEKTSQQQHDPRSDSPGASIIQPASSPTTLESLNSVEEEMGQQQHDPRSASPGATIIQPAPSPATLESLNSVREQNPHNAADATGIFEHPSGSKQSSLPDVALAITKSPDPSLVGTKVPLVSVPFLVGRGENVQLNLRNDQGVTQRHIEVNYLAGKFTIRDLDTTNGTYVNGKRLGSDRVEHLFFGDQISLGVSTILTFVYQALHELPDLTDTVLDNRYLLKKLLHVSPKAAVYAADDQNFKRFKNRPVALKLFSPQLAEHPGYMEQINREAGIAVGLRHSHICTVLDFGEARLELEDNKPGQVIYLCMDLMDGGSLTERIEGDKTIPLEQIGDWLYKLGDALDYVHEQGLVHSGIKPNSIAFDRENNVFLTDFAAAGMSNDPNSHLIVGAPAFLAPEQWEGQPSTPAVDQYALAVITYLLVTGSHPYEGQEYPDVRKRNFARGPMPAHEEAARNGKENFPSPVSLVLDRAMATDPDNRYSSAGIFVHAFISAIDGENEPPPRTPRVFICYQRDTSAGWANLFAWKLKDDYGFSVFVDTQELDSAVRVSLRLTKEIEKCDVFVCFLANSTLSSPWVKEEIRLAYEDQKPMVPVFQESFPHRVAENGLEPSIKTLLSYKGVHLLDKLNIHIEHSVEDLAQIVKQTIVEVRGSCIDS